MIWSNTQLIFNLSISDLATYRNLNFVADKPIKYNKLRIKMARIYENQGMKLSKNFDTLNKRADNLTFHDGGRYHIETTPLICSTNQCMITAYVMKELKEQVNKNSNRIIEKVKEMRENFSKAIIKDSRSGSEKPVF